MEQYLTTSNLVIAALGFVAKMVLDGWGKKASPPSPTKPALDVESLLKLLLAKLGERGGSASAPQSGLKIASGSGESHVVSIDDGKVVVETA